MPEFKIEDTPWYEKLSDPDEPEVIETFDPFGFYDEHLELNGEVELI